MANNFNIAAATASLMCDAAVDQLDDGVLRIYDGSQPATPETAISTQHLLVEFRLPTPAFGAASAGVATAEAIPEEDAVHTDMATWFRVLKTDGASPETLTAVFDGTVGTSGCDMNLNTTALVTGVGVAITSWTVTMPVG